MAQFNDFDIEVENEKGNTPEQQIVTVTTAGAPMTVTPSSGKITNILVINPNKGPNKNQKNDLIYLSLDGSTNYLTIQRGTNLSISGIYLDNFNLDANNNNVVAEVFITHD